MKSIVSRGGGDTNTRAVDGGGGGEREREGRERKRGGREGEGGWILGLAFLLQSSSQRQIRRREINWRKRINQC